MQFVDDEGMSVPKAIALMITQVRVIGIKLGMQMFDDLRIIGGPDRSGDRRAEKGQKPEGRQGQRHPGREAEPPGKRIGQEPAGMRQRELRREDRRPVSGLRRAPQKPAGRRHDGGVADPEQGPGDKQRRPRQTGRDGGVGPPR